MGRVYGYARVSSTEQHLDRQIEALSAYKVEGRHIITDKVSAVTCNTHKDQDDNGKVTQISIEFGTFYPETLFQELPPDWTIYEYNRVKDNQILQPSLTGLSCVIYHPPDECDQESIDFEKEITISNIESWLE
ncbi:MAG: hypothetical protein ACFWUE_05890 [Xylanivirga thermophila]|jgi:hypothetical protein|uniref:recombinase family protein n=1 Tax=Xylanivirga thermophila TaxID=2496273 RepID=UPI0039F5A83A